MDFSYNRGTAAHWYGNPDLIGMYAAYRKQAAYCRAHGFTWANTFAARKASVTAEILLNVLSILTEAGFHLMLWLVPQAETEWTLAGRELEPVYTYFRDIVKAVDSKPDVARRIRYLVYAPEIGGYGTVAELASYLAWLEPLFRGWLAESSNLRMVELIGGLGSIRTTKDAEKLAVIREHVDVVSLSEYPFTDADIQAELQVWKSYPRAIRQPFLITEMNNKARKLNGPYTEANHWGHLPVDWLKSWEGMGAEVACLHRGNSDFADSYAWFDRYGNPLFWLSDELAKAISGWKVPEPKVSKPTDFFTVAPTGAGEVMT